MASLGPKIVGGASFRTFRCLWMLEEIGIPYVHSPAWPGSAEVVKLNPLGKVPVLLEEDGFSMYESAAINTYLGDKYRDKNPDLIPLPGTRQRGLYEQTVSILTTELDSQGLWIHRKHSALGDIFSHIPEAVKHARKYFNKTNRALVQQLTNKGGPYLLGKDFSAADIIYVHCLDWSETIGWGEKWEGEEVVKEYIQRCTSRPAYARVRKMRDIEKRHNHRKGSSKL